MRNCCFVLILGISLWTLGCGGAKKTGRDPVYPVSGKVVYKGSPVAQAEVVFVCVEKNRSAFGRTDDEGRFTLTTFAPKDGAVDGKQVVVVTKLEQAPATKEPEVTDPAYDPFKVAGKVPPPKPKNQIPAKYGDVKTSDLIAVVSAGSNPEMTLDLKD